MNICTKLLFFSYFSSTLSLSYFLTFSRIYFPLRFYSTLHTFCWRRKTFTQPRELERRWKTEAKVVIPGPAAGSEVLISCRPQNRKQKHDRITKERKNNSHQALQIEFLPKKNFFVILFQVYILMFPTRE